MRVTLERRWVDHLRRLPESGMGYQRVDVWFSDGRQIRNALVFNSQDLELPDDCGNLQIAAIDLHRPDANKR